MPVRRVQLYHFVGRTSTHTFFQGKVWMAFCKIKEKYHKKNECFAKY
jgi:hypothetical protein